MLKKVCIGGGSSDLESDNNWKAMDNDTFSVRMAADCFQHSRKLK